MWYRQESGSLDLAEVSTQVTALQGAISLANQANEGHRFSPAELQQAAQPLQVPPSPEAQCFWSDSVTCSCMPTEENCFSKTHVGLMLAECHKFAEGFVTSDCSCPNIHDQI